MTEDTPEIINQTQFSEESPWQHSMERKAEKKAQPALSWREKLKQPNYQVAAALAVIIALMIGGLALVAVVVNTTTFRPRQTPQPSATPTISSTQLQRQLEILETQLEASDPTLEVMPLPPIDITIRLERTEP